MKSCDIWGSRKLISSNLLFKYLENYTLYPSGIPGIQLLIEAPIVFAEPNLTISSVADI